MNASADDRRKYVESVTTLTVELLMAHVRVRGLDEPAATLVERAFSTAQKCIDVLDDFVTTVAADEAAKIVGQAH